MILNKRIDVNGKVASVVLCLDCYDNLKDDYVIRIIGPKLNAVCTNCNCTGKKVMYQALMTESWKKYKRRCEAEGRK